MEAEEKAPSSREFRTPFPRLNDWILAVAGTRAEGIEAGPTTFRFETARELHRLEVHSFWLPRPYHCSPTKRNASRDLRTDFRFLRIVQSPLRAKG
jgi:hypothetical protein